MTKGAQLRISKVTLKPGHPRTPGKASFKIVSEGGPRRFTEAYFEKKVFFSTERFELYDVWVRRPEPA